MANSVWPHPWDSPGENTGVGCHFLLQGIKVKSERKVAQPCPTLCDPMDCSLPGSSVHGIFQARVLGWGVVAFSDLEEANEMISLWKWSILEMILQVYVPCHIGYVWLSLVSEYAIFSFLVYCYLFILLILPRQNPHPFLPHFPSPSIDFK